MALAPKSTLMPCRRAGSRGQGGLEGRGGASRSRPSGNLTLMLQGHGAPLLGYYFLPDEPCEVGLAVANSPLSQREKRKLQGLNATSVSAAGQQQGRTGRGIRDPVLGVGQGKGHPGCVCAGPFCLGFGVLPISPRPPAS